MSCRGCTERGWQGLVDGDGKRYHERATAPGEREVIRRARGYPVLQGS